MKKTLQQKAMAMILAAAALTQITANNSIASEKHGTDCYSCHTLTKQEAQKLLSVGDASKTIQVESVKQSPIKGLWQVIAKKEDKKGIYYIDYSKTYVVDGSIYNPQKRENITQTTMEHAIIVKITPTITKNAILLGNKNAKMKATVFTDLQCPHCYKLHKELKKITAKRNDIAFNIVLYPIVDMHPTAYDQSKSVYCKKTIQALESAYAGQTMAFATCDASAIDENISFAQRYGITGTPTIVLSDGTISFGYLDSKSIISLILEAKGR